MRRKLLPFLMVFLQAFACHAVNDMTIFLKSAAYGTAAGAILGLATLAVSENPGGKMSNVARGASLGLYAGIGFGLYTIYGKKETPTEFSSVGPVWFTPIAQERRVDGLQVNWAYRFF